MAPAPSRHRTVRRELRMWAVVGCTAIVACGGDSSSSTPTTDTPSTTSTTPIGTTPADVTTTPAVPTTVPPTTRPEAPMTAAPDSPVPSEVIASPMVRTAIDDLVERTGADRSMIEVVSVEEVDWPDGSIGCPQPGMVYTQAIVNGSKIVLRHDGTDYAYHQGGSRSVFHCPPSSTVDK